jgi:hypothetical protein
MAKGNKEQSSFKGKKNLKLTFNLVPHYSNESSNSCNFSTSILKSINSTKLQGALQPTLTSFGQFYLQR